LKGVFLCLSSLY